MLLEQGEQSTDSVWDEKKSAQTPNVCCTCNREECLVDVQELPVYVCVTPSQGGHTLSPSLRSFQKGWM